MTASRGGLLTAATPTPTDESPAARAAVAAVTRPLTDPESLVGETIGTVTRPLAGPDDALTTATKPLVGAAAPVLRTVHATVAGVLGPIEPVLRTVHATTAAVLGPVLDTVRATTAAVLKPIEPIVSGVLPASPTPAPPDGVRDSETPPAAPAPDQPPTTGPDAGTAAPVAGATKATTTVAPAPAVRARWAAAVIGPRIGASSSITKPPQQPAEAVRAAGGARTEPAVPGSGLGGGCVPGGCAHTSEAIGPSGQPQVLPAVLAVRPDARGLLVAPPTRPPFTGRLPGVSPLPG